MNQYLEQPEMQQSSLRDILTVLFRQKYKILIFFLTVVVVVTVGTFLQPETYQSDAKILIRLGRESVTLEPTADVGKVMHVAQSREQEMNSELEILKSRDVVRGVVDSLGADYVLTQGGTKERSTSFTDKVKSFLKSGLQSLLAAGGTEQGNGAEMSDTEKAVKALKNGLSFEAYKESSILALSFKAEDPDFARTVVSAVIQEFKEKHIEARSVSGSYEFFVEQIDRVESELKQTEKQLQQIKQESNVASLEKQRDILIERIDELKTEIATQKSEREATRSEVLHLREILTDIPAMVENERVSGNQHMRTELYKLQLKEQDLLSKYSEDNIRVREIRRQIDSARALLEKDPQVTLRRNTTHQELSSRLLREQARFASLQSRISSLESELKETREELDHINSLEYKLEELQRSRQVQKNNYQKYADNLEQARIDQELRNQKISNISIVQGATMPVDPVGPNKPLNFILSLFIGGLGGLAVAFVSEYFDHTIKTPEDIEEKLDLRVLSSIPEREAA